MPADEDARPPESPAHLQAVDLIQTDGELEQIIAEDLAYYQDQDHVTLTAEKQKPAEFANVDEDNLLEMVDSAGLGEVAKEVGEESLLQGEEESLLQGEVDEESLLQGEGESLLQGEEESLLGHTGSG